MKRKREELDSKSSAGSNSLQPAAEIKIGAKDTGIRIRRQFKATFGEYCGWAHSVLFAGELPDWKKLWDKGTQKK